MKCDIYTRKDIFVNVVISGGNTMYRDFKVNLEDKFRSILAVKHPSARGRVVAPTERLHSPWIGGSVLGSLSFFSNECIIDKEFYDEEGPERALNIKCNYIKYPFKFKIN